MNPQLPFDTIESAQGFVALFTEVVLATKCDIEADIQQDTNANFPRRLHALKIIVDKLATLELHLKRSSCIFNDLRSLRRLLLGERSSSAVPVRPKPIATADAETLALSPSPPVSLSGVSKNKVTRDVSSYVRVRKRAISSGGVAAARHPRAADAVPWYSRPDFNRSWGKNQIIGK